MRARRAQPLTVRSAHPSSARAGLQARTGCQSPGCRAAAHDARPRLCRRPGGVRVSAARRGGRAAGGRGGGGRRARAAGGRLRRGRRAADRRGRARAVCAPRASHPTHAFSPRQGRARGGNAAGRSRVWRHAQGAGRGARGGRRRAVLPGARARHARRAEARAWVRSPLTPGCRPCLLWRGVHWRCRASSVGPLTQPVNDAIVKWRARRRPIRLHQSWVRLMRKLSSLLDPV